jgi:hypothetical protein
MSTRRALSDANNYRIELEAATRRRQQRHGLRVLES